MRDNTAIPNEENKQDAEPLLNQEQTQNQTDTATSLPLPAYFLITEECTVTVKAAAGGTDKTAEFPVALHSGDTVCIRSDGFAVNGADPTPDDVKANIGSEMTLHVTDGDADRILKNGTTVDEAFYQEAAASKKSDAANAEKPSPAGDTAADAPAEEPAADSAEAAEHADVEAVAEAVENVELVEAAETDPVKSAEPNSGKTEESYSVRQLLDDALDLFESVITSVFVVMLLFTFVFCVATVDGDSMVPTLTSGDRLMVSRFDHSFDLGDILILDSRSACVQDPATGEFYTADGLGKRIVKRLIGQAGDVVNIDFSQGIVYVNGNALTEPYTNTLTTRDNGAFTYPLTVPEGYVFVLGDNRNISKDSRHPQVGLVPVDDIIGKVVLRLTPFSEFGVVN